METGLHLPHPPQKDEAENLEDCEYLLGGFFLSYFFVCNFKI